MLDYICQNNSSLSSPKSTVISTLRPCNHILFRNNFPISSLKSTVIFHSASLIFIKNSPASRNLIGRLPTFPSPDSLKPLVPIIILKLPIITKITTLFYYLITFRWMYFILVLLAVWQDGTSGGGSNPRTPEKLLKI